MPTKTDLVRIDYRLTFTTLFHCGTGARTGLIDRTVIRDSENYLYVPGSTFKGVLREHCEQLARFYVDEAEKERVTSPHNTEEALQGLGGKPPTMLTRIFGSHNVAGRLFFDDARLSDEDQKQYKRGQDGEQQEEEKRVNRRDYKGLQVNLYTQVRLDRPTRTAVSGALYTSEFGTRNIAFEGSVQGWLECTAIDSLRNERFPDYCPTYSLLLLLAGLRMVERLGGNKSSGKGQCQCDIERVEINGHVFAQDEWLAWLDGLDQLAHYADAGEDRA